jgi:hypothetical protein
MTSKTKHAAQRGMVAFLHACISFVNEVVLAHSPVQCGEAKAEMVLGDSTCPQSITEDARDTGDRVQITKMCAANTIVVEIADRASRDCRV